MCVTVQHPLLILFRPLELEFFQGGMAEVSFQVLAQGVVYTFGHRIHTRIQYPAEDGLGGQIDVCETLFAAVSGCDSSAVMVPNAASSLKLENT